MSPLDICLYDMNVFTGVWRLVRSVRIQEDERINNIFFTRSLYTPLHPVEEVWLWILPSSEEKSLNEIFRASRQVNA